MTPAVKCGAWHAQRIQRPLGGHETYDLLVETTHGVSPLGYGSLAREIAEISGRHGLAKFFGYFPS
jgi:hypothetical protein